VDRLAETSKPDVQNTRYIILGQPEKSTVAEQRFEIGQSINFRSTSILEKAIGYIDHVIKEATEIRLHPRNFNRNTCFTLSQPWYPVTNMLKQYRDPSIKKQDQAKQAPHSTHQPPMAHAQKSNMGWSGHTKIK
jgi:hypothetical protein